MNQKIMTKEEIQQEIELLKQQIEAKELILQGLLDMLDRLNGIEEDE